MFRFSIFEYMSAKTLAMILLLGLILVSSLNLLLSIPQKICV